MILGIYIYKLNENTSGTKRETDTSMVERQKNEKECGIERESSERKFSGEQSGKSGALKIKS